MPKLPNPPSADGLRAVASVIHVIPRGALLWRIYFRDGAHPATWEQFRTFGPVENSRFDHHQLPSRVQERGILYAADDGGACLAEVFQRNRVIDRRAAEPWLVGFTLQAPVPLLDLTGAWCTAAGASQALSTGQRPRARAWSRAIYDAYPDVAGLWYPSSMHGGSHAVALYERAQPSLAPTPFFNHQLSEPRFDDLVLATASRVGYEVVV